MLKKIILVIGLVLSICLFIVGAIGFADRVMEGQDNIVLQNVIHAADFQYFDMDGQHYFQFELEGMICVEKVGYPKSLSCVEHGN